MEALRLFFFAGMDMERMLSFKAEGNEHYQQGRFEEAMIGYSKAMRLLPDLDDSLAPDAEMRKQAAIILCKRSAAAMSTKRAVSALADAQRASDYDGSNWKAHWRTGLAFMMMAPRLERSEQVSPAILMILMMSNHRACGVTACEMQS